MKKKNKVKKKNKGTVENGTKSSQPKWAWIALAIVSFLLYANTFGHEYAQDDAIVITDNMFTQDGLSGIPSLLTKDTFFGFFKLEGKQNLVAGGRYRPLSMITFAIENEFFGNNATISHIVNALLYALLVIGIYFFLLASFNKIIPTSRLTIFAFIISLIYAAHPIHTEAVANIKGRDEIMTMLLSVAALLFLLKTTNKTKALKTHVIAGLLFFLALLSKENAITFIPIAFLAFYLLQKKSFVISAKKTMTFIIPAVVFLSIRFSILGFSTGDEPMELMNNPFIKLVNGGYVSLEFGEKLATIFYILGYYIKLLLFPHPLTNDYYPRQIDIMAWNDLTVIASALGMLLLVASVFYFWKKNRVISFSIAFYLITISLYSNILFPIGTNMSERFLFMPSLGFSILLGYGLWNIYYKFGPYVTYCLLGITIGLYSIKTVTRNDVWENDFTLYSTDVQISNNSAKALNAAGGVLITASNEEKNVDKKNQMLNQAISHLDKALKIHPTYKSAWLLKGNAHYYLSDYDVSISAYDRALGIDAGFEDAIKNLGVALRDAGRNAGEILNDLGKARSYLNRALQINPADPETIRLLGITEGLTGNYEMAIRRFTQLTEIEPEKAVGYVLLSQTYAQMENQEQALINRQKALALDANAFK